MHSVVAVVITFAFVVTIGGLALFFVGWWEKRLGRGFTMRVVRVHTRRSPHSR